MAACAGCSSEHGNNLINPALTIMWSHGDAQLAGQADVTMVHAGSVQNIKFTHDMFVVQEAGAQKR